MNNQVLQYSAYNCNGKHLGQFFGRAGTLTVDERSAPPLAKTSQYKTKEVKHWNFRTQATNRNHPVKFVYSHDHA